METVTIEGLRCFRRLRDVRLAPLTILVGENSSGKSTFLAALRLIHDACRVGRAPNFGEAPFDLGTWDEIAHFHGGKGKRAKEIVLGWNVGLKDDNARFRVSFEEHEGQPRVASWKVDLDRWGAEIRFPQAPAEPSVLVSIDGEQETVSSDWLPSGMLAFDHEFSSIAILIPMLWRYPTESRKQRSLFKETGHWPGQLLGKLDIAMRPYALAPIRTMPRRNYEPLQDNPVPDGAHVPSRMSRLAAGKRDEWEALRAEMIRFGKGSGLFDDIVVHHRGLSKKKVTQPFSIEVEIRDQQGRRSIADVGYGVSQALPLLVDAIQGKPGRWILLQQPEVHLHPKAQAEMGTFLVRLTKKHSHRFVVETHSGYIVDRVRMAVRDGTIGPDDVALLFFERRGAEVEVHQIAFDVGGNVTGAPTGYRSFFIEEELRLLGDAGVPDR